MAALGATDGPGRGTIAYVARLVFAAVLIGAMSVVFCVSFASIIYTGPVAPFLSQGIGYTLIGAVIVGAVGALTLSYRGTICQPQDISAVLLAIAAAGAAGATQADPERAFGTVLVLVALTSIVTGAGMFAVGALRLAPLVRYVPLPVTSGFLAASGLLLVKSAIEMTIVGDAGVLTQVAAEWFHWVPWLLLGAALVGVVRIGGNGLVIPAALVLAVAVFHLVLLATGGSLETARADGLLIGPFADASFVTGINPAVALEADWGAIATQIPMMLAIAGLAILGALLNASGLELVTHEEIALDRDMRGTGIANILAGLGGGVVGYHLLAETTLVRRFGIKGMAAGLSVAAVCALGLLFGATALGSLPLGLFAAAVAFLGIELMWTALWEHGRRMPAHELLLVVVTPLIALAFGFLPAVGFGIVIACVLFVIHYASVDVVRVSTTGASFRARTERGAEETRRLKELGELVLIYRLSGFLFFGSAQRFIALLQDRLDGSRARIVVIDFKTVVGIDMSAWAAFERLGRYCARTGHHLVLAGLSPKLREQYARRTKGKDAGDTNLANDLDEALEGIEERLLNVSGAALAYAEQPPGGLSDFAEWLLDYGERLTATPGEVLITEGEISTDLLILLSGRVKVLVADRKGGTTTINRLRPGAIVGEVGYYASIPRTATIVADGEADVLRIGREAMAQWELDEPQHAAAFHRRVAMLLAQRLARTTHSLRDAES